MRLEAVQTRKYEVTIKLFTRLAMTVMIAVVSGVGSVSVAHAEDFASPAPESPPWALSPHP